MSVRFKLISYLGSFYLKGLVNMAKIQAYTDKLAIGLSLLCTLHCLIFPVLIVLIPSFAALSISNDELFHQWMLVGVLPSSLIALTMGCKKHGRFTFLALGLLGVSLLSVTALWGHDFMSENLEKFFTLISSLLIAVAHFNNSRLCHTKKC